MGHGFLVTSGAQLTENTVYPVLMNFLTNEKSEWSTILLDLNFSVADRVIVTSKHNDDEQYIWESDSESFSVSKDPRGNTLSRGTQVSVHMKEEANDFLEESTLKDLIRKYSQFINFNIYMWSSKTEEVEEPIEEEEKKEDAAEDKDDEDEEEEGKVEEEKEEKPKTKKVSKTVWDWELMNSVKPIWTRRWEHMGRHHLSRGRLACSTGFTPSDK